MTRSNSSKRALALGTAGLLLTAVLGGCNSGAAPSAAPTDAGTGDASDAASAALPLSTSTPATVASAPPVTALPTGQPVRVRHLANPRDSYAYLDRAYYQEDAVEDAPPDYTFEENGVRPWTWTTRDGSRVISEPVAGGYRYYYYQAGADSPYLVRDPRNSYAYDNGALVAVFNASGQQVDAGDGSEQVGYAGRYLDRGQYLYRGSSTGQHVPVNAYAWSDRRSDIAAQRAAWHQEIGANPDWSAWNNQHHDDEQRVWNDDRAEHQQAAQQFGTWQQQRFQGQPPQLYAQPNGSGNHTAAIVGGVVAAGLAAVAIHDLTSHHDNQPQNQNQGQNPGNNPGYNAARPQQQGMAPQNNGVRPVAPAPGTHYAQPQTQPENRPQIRPTHETAQPARAAAPQYAQPTHQAPAPTHEAAQPARPERVMAPHNTQPAPHYAAPMRQEMRPAPAPVVHAVAEPARPAPKLEQHPAPAPHPAEVHPAQPHPGEPHPGEREHEHDHQ